MSTPTCPPLQQPLFIPLLCRWTYPGLWSPIFCHHWEPCCLIPLQRLIFLFKAGGIFSSFQSLLPHTAQVLLTFLTFFPSGKPLPLAGPLFSPTLSAEVDFCHLQPSTLIQGRLWSMWLFYGGAHYSPVLWDIKSCSLLGMWLRNGHTVLPIPALMDALHDSPSTVTTTSRTKSKTNGVNLS